MIKSIKYKKRDKQDLYEILYNKSMIGWMAHPSGFLRKSTNQDEFTIHLWLDQVYILSGKNLSDSKIRIERIIKHYLKWRNLITGPKIMKAHKEFLKSLNQ